MKYRITKNGLNTYFIQIKKSFFSPWKVDYGCFDSIERSVESVKYRIEKYKKHKKCLKLENKIQVIHTYDADAPKCFEHDACVYAESSCLRDK